MVQGQHPFGHPDFPCPACRKYCAPISYGNYLKGWWQKRVYRDLLRKQRTTDGSFEPDSGRYDYGPVLSTAFAVLTLAIPDEVIPIFQR